MSSTDRRALVSIRRPPSLSSFTYVHGAPYVLIPMIRRTCRSPGRTLPLSSKRKATPGTSTRSSQPRRIAGGWLHQVGYTNTRVCARCSRAACSATIGSTIGCSPWYARCSSVDMAAANPRA